MTSSVDTIIRRRADVLGVYIHFPYCIHKCSYCDFYSVGMDRSLGGAKSVPAKALESYERGIRSEFQIRRKQFDKFQKINTIFFGGGTASLLPATVVSRILAMLRDEFEFDPEIEITLEGNPENFSPAYIREIKDAGINRIHVGVQSLREKTLETLDRYFDSERYSALLDTLSNSAIVNRGADLMYGVPGQGELEFFEDLDRLLATGVTHLSLYSLTVEHGTPYELAVRKNTASAPDEDLQGAIFETLPGYMSDRGFLHYEISNFGRPGYLSRHNLRYWLYEPTLALGPGAHGFTGTQRYGNPRNTLTWAEEPAGSLMEMHEPALELPLCLPRILLPVASSDLEEMFAEVGPDAASRGFALLKSWERKGYATSGSTFQWNLRGMTFLNDRMIELQNVLSG